MYKPISRSRENSQKPLISVKTACNASLALSIRITKMNAMCQADIVSTGRNQSVIHSMMAKVAFLGDTFIVVKVNGIIWARLDAFLTAGAQFIIHDHDAVGSFGNRLFGADVDTWRFITMLTHVDAIRKSRNPTDHFGTVFRNPY